jgi:hypothetical protein
VLLDPQQFRCGEAGHREIAGDLTARRHGALEGRALRGAAAIVPQDRRPQRPVGGVEERRAVHLAGEPDGANLAAALRVEPYDGAIGCGPPIRRILFRPAGMRARDGKWRSCLAGDGPAVVDQDGLDAGGPDVDAEKHRASILRP